MRSLPSASRHRRGTAKSLSRPQSEQAYSRSAEECHSSRVTEVVGSEGAARVDDIADLESVRAHFGTMTVIAVHKTMTGPDRHA
jgi:hypothetical protein